MTVRHSEAYMKHVAPKPTILGVDPGLATGIAIAHWHNNQWVYHTSTHKEIQGVWELINEPVDIVICERFAASLIDKYGLHTVDLVGGIKALCWANGLTYVEHTPMQRKPYIEYASSKVPPEAHVPRHEQRHQIDALSHVIRWLYQNQHITSLKVE